mmetsp:Transcript_20525/g.19766  ORF Transcript_20525/g.19766 Transcript_20525/m.19766 type:complete len:181 (-) Transcript_20525:77-619(-)|eukprot:CAMPEP_0197831528 /NCGR_PEP_ID=MMETSP1437-20131217/10722_1 /TAXON_ID=49252 ORGANISM="Eucampia antarctica, Strain CCMP1452" /NCGR_SAMPLE_ID=MMETSP1437 /ASSEMBLY_ACC=CAM_ASM_001096 /LENGTH=180 /DNA_ID=CAMNT_0043434481 /DNA_START=124 /DNA_END=666 /DNA_ORIENTATION=+
MDIEFGSITLDNVEQLRQINTACFPVSYNDSFYKGVVKKNNEDLCKFAYMNGFVIGAICARVEPIPEQKSDTGTGGSSSSAGTTRNRLYIMTLAVLGAYRSRGVGAKLVKSVLDYYEEHKDENNHEMSNVDEIMLHVQTSNEDAMKFYIDKFDFEKGDIVKNYYRRIDPPDCYVLLKRLK